MRRLGIGLAPRHRCSPWVLAAAALIGLACRPAAASESWDALFIGGGKVGYMKVSVKPVKDGDRQLVNVLVNIDCSIKRGKDSSRIELEYGTIETPTGEILKLDTRAHLSQQVIRVHGNVVDGKMTLKIANGNQRQEEVLDWSPDTLGPYGAEMSLSRSPIAPGEVRTIKTFIPIENKIGLTTLTARGKEPVALGGGSSRELLRIDQEVSIAGKKRPEMTTVLWVDSGGQILKSFTDTNGGMFAYRTTKEAAMRAGPMTDQIDASIVKLGRSINNPESTRNIVYRVSLAGIDPTEIFPNDRRQVLGTDGLLEVKTAGPGDGTAGPESVGEEYLRSNPFVTSNDPRVVALAKRAVGGETDPWAKAQAINRWVATNLRNKNFETTFAPADEVARTLAGDCTEHGVLTAAMCRAEGIPARVVTGLVYANNLGGFGFHMWNEVYVNRRWVAIDSAFDESSVDAVHIKLSDSSLDGVAPFDAFMSVARITGKLKIEVIEVR